MSSQPLIDVRPDHWNIVRDILRKHVPQYDVWAFGSRAKWVAKPYSDLDLAVISDEPLPIQVSAELAEDFAESDLPWRVDVVDWATTSASFRKIIERDKVVVQKREEGAGSSRVGTGRTGGREATSGVIPGRYALSVGCPDIKPPDGWAWTPLSSVAQLESGHTPSRKHPEYWDGDIPWIGIKDATENHGRTILDTHQHVTKLGLENSSARLLPANTVCLSRTASVGFVVVMGRPMATSQDFVNWVCGPNIDPHYLKYVLLAENEALWRFASGTTHQTIYYPEAKALHICLPPIDEQRSIVDVLLSIDEKIEKNIRINDLLEKMSRAIFQSWFVDFEPVRLKFNEGVASGLGMADEGVSAIFPSSFEDSVLGAIPHGWRVVTLGGICEEGGGNIQTGPFGTQLHASDYVSDGIPSIMPSDLRDNRIDTTSIARISESDAERLNVYRVRPGDVVYSRRGDVERRSLIRRAEAGWLCGTGCLRVRFGPKGLNPYFGAAYLGSPDSRAWVVRHAVGATMPNLNTSILGSLPVVVPPAELQARFSEIVGPWDELGTIALAEANNLAEVRDSLLPRLLSGVLKTPKEVAA